VAIARRLPAPIHDAPHTAILFWGNDIPVRGRLEDMNWREAPYAERFPELAPLAAYLEAGMGVPPAHNVCLRNLGKPALRHRWDGQPMVAEWLVETGCVDESAPGFVDPGETRLWTRTIALRPGPQTIGAHDETGKARPAQVLVVGTGPGLVVRQAP